MQVTSTAIVRGALALTTIALTIAACAGSDGDDAYVATRGTVIQNATVVDTRDGSLKTGQAIVIDAGRIVRIAPNDAVRASGTARAIDASGKYVVPGLLDMHTHAMVHIDESPSYFPLMLANGITGFREMGEFAGSFPTMLGRARQLNLDVAAGLIDAPEVLLVPGEIFSAATSAASAAQGVDQQKAQGVDFIKVISANRNAMLAFLSEAKAQGLYVAGHLTAAVSATESSQAGWKTIEHLGSGIGNLLDCATDETAIRQAIVSRAGAGVPTFGQNAANATFFQRTIDTYGADRCVTLAKLFVENGTWQVPTLRRVRGLNAGDDPVLVNDANLIYASTSRKATWAQLSTTFAALPASAKATFAQFYALQKASTKLMKDNGVKMLAGSDAGVASIWVIPGFGLHEDFHELASAGLSPLAILQMATLNGAEFLGRQATMGTVDVGKNADLLLLDANPILDAANLDKIAGLFLKGRYFSKEALDKMKSDTATAYQNAPAAMSAPSHAEDDHTD